MSQTQTELDARMQHDPGDEPAASPLLWLLLLLAVLALGFWWYDSRERGVEQAATTTPAPAVQEQPTAKTGATEPATAHRAAAARSQHPTRPAAQRERAPQPIASSKVLPRYPASALRVGEGGTAVVDVVVGTDGVPVDVSIDARSGNRDLDRAALQAVRQWRFQPALHDGKPVQATVKVPVEFTPSG
ncbi:MAG: energy transducer TonB [Pseudoxanthomonas sp.]